METYGLAIRENTLSGPMARPHRHHDIELNFVLKGEIRLFCGEEHALIHAGQVALFWAACLHRITGVSPATRMTWVTVGLNAFLAWDLPPDRPRAVLDGTILVDPTPPDRSGDDAALKRWLIDADESRGPLARDCFLGELQQRVRRLMMEGRSDPTEGGGTRRKLPGTLPPRIEEMARIIVRRHREPLTIREVAESCGLHPGYATTAFRRVFGISLREHLARQRIMTARKLLTTTDHTVQEIAYTSGFQTSSRFYEAFRKQTGTSPLRYRRQMRGGTP